MKTPISLTFILVFALSYASAQKSEAPDYYLNNKKVSYNELHYLNYDKIDSIRIDKSSKNGAVYLYAKEKTKFLTLDNIVKKHTDLKEIDSTLLFQINNDIVYDISNIKIDTSYFIYVEVKYVSEVDYIDEKLKKMKIVIIDLEKEERKPEIMLRGNNELEAFY